MRRRAAGLGRPTGVSRVTLDRCVGTSDGWCLLAGVVPSLFEPLSLGAVRADNRVLMAPLTRMRASVPGDVPNDLMREY